MAKRQMSRSQRQNAAKQPAPTPAKRRNVRVMTPSRSPDLTRGVRALYEAAGRGDRAAQSFVHARTISSEYLLGSTLDTIRRRCRYEVRNNPIAFSIVDYMATTTAPLRPRVRDQEILDLWNSWTEECDADGWQSFDEMQRLVLRELITAGDVFAWMRARRLEDGLAVPFQIQLIPGEMVPLINSEEEMTTSGIAFTPIGARRGFWVAPVHPGASDITANSGMTVERGTIGAVLENYRFVSAENMVQVARRVEAGQVRGEPWLVRSLIRLHELDEYEDAELLKKKFSARINLILKKTIERQAGAFIEDGDDDEAEEAFALPTLNPGDNMVAPEGYEVDISKTHDAGPTFPEYVRTVLREACAGLAPVEMVLDDMQSPERTIQLALKRYEGQMMDRRAMLARQFCRPVWRRFLNEARAAGTIERTDGEMAQLYRAPWVGRPLPSIRPLQEAQADTERMRNGTMSHAEAVEKYGQDYAEHIESLAREAADRDERGLILTGDARRVSKSGVLQEDTTDE